MTDIYRNIKTNSAGYDNLSWNLINDVFSILAESLTHIINLSFQTGVVPEQIKTSVIRPTYKSGKKNQFKNYRPISILPLFSKLFEKAFVNRLNKYLMRNNLLDMHQFGFRKCHSTDLALVAVNQYICTQHVNKKVVVGIQIDLSKAFDTINIQILKRKLTKYGIRGIPNLWISNYLTNRIQRTNFKNQLSSPKTINIGVPQGSILGPILFLIYINDLPSIEKTMKTFMYADDSHLFFTGNSCETAINLAIDNMKKVAKWFQCNRLSLNFDKTKYLIFNYNIHRTIENKLPDMLINSQNIEQVTSAIFLGYTIQRDLKWDGHIQNISRKISIGIGIMTKLRKFLPGTSLFIIYYTHIYPHLIRGILVWGFTTRANQNRLMILQKRALRIINNSPPRTPSKELFIKYDILPIDKLYTQQLLLHMYKVHHNMLPNMFKEYYHKSYNISTRNSDKFVIPKYVNPLIEKTIVVQAPRIYNLYSQFLEYNVSIGVFKRKIKKILMNEFQLDP